ncbi:MAG: DUF883 family protein [Planctomycetes bacterium]|nr:DUF883 family protein [Planctomycetota bacterium]
MSSPRHPLERRLNSVAGHARTLIEATVDAADQRVVGARDGLLRALEAGGDVLDHAKERVEEGARSVDKLVRKHPYETLAVAFGVGLLAGVLARRR